MNVLKYYTTEGQKIGYTAGLTPTKEIIKSIWKDYPNAKRITHLRGGKEIKSYLRLSKLSYLKVYKSTGSYVYDDDSIGNNIDRW